MSDAMLSIIAAECGGLCANEPDLIERIKKAMAPVANGHWAVTDDDLCLRGAVAAVLLDPGTTEDEKTRIKFTLDQMRSVSALMSGVPVNIEAALGNPEDIETIPLIKMWNAAKTASQ